MYNSIIFDNSDYNITFTDIQYEISIINPFIELKRYKLIQEICRTNSSNSKKSSGLNKILDKEKQTNKPGSFCCICLLVLEVGLHDYE